MQTFSNGSVIRSNGRANPVTTRTLVGINRKGHERLQCLQKSVGGDAGYCVSRHSRTAVDGHRLVRTLPELLTARKSLVLLKK